MKAIWVLGSFIAGLLVPDPWTLWRLYRHRVFYVVKTSRTIDNVIGLNAFSRHILVAMKRRFQGRPSQVIVKEGRFFVKGTK